MSNYFKGTQLVGHTSPETAFVVADYPYGFRLRCQKRYWIETKAGFGQRLVTQTSNPKKPGLVWNKPKAGVYQPLLVLIQDEHSGHLDTAGLTFWTADVDHINAFTELVLDADQQATLKVVQTAYERSKK